MRTPLLALAPAAALLALACSSSSPQSSTAPASPPPRAASLRPAEPPPPTPAPPPSSPPAAAVSPVSDYREVIKLYQANISEDFILQRVREEGRSYRLAADDVIALRTAGVSERVIQAMLDSGRDAAAFRPVPEDRVTVVAVERPRGDVELRWDGVARREDGVVMFHDRWHVGTLSLAEGQLRWLDAKDSSRNLLVPMSALSEQFLTCLKKPGGNECFEWGFRTKRGESYRFRDVSWEQGGNGKPLEIHATLKSRFPTLVDSERGVDEKEK